MDRIESTIVVDAAPNVCYEKWHHFEQFPHFMTNVEEVQQTGDKSWHWVVNGPLGHRTEWDAEIDDDVRNQLISWHSLTGSEVAIAGIVNFTALGQDKTEVTCQVQYDPPAGTLGEIVTHLFANPKKMVEEDLENFKHLVEGTNVPVEKAHQGKVMEPNPFVVPPPVVHTETAFKGGTPITPESYDEESFSPSAPRVDEEGYELIYGLEDDLPVMGGTEASVNIAREDIIEIQMLSEEETPYLGTEGALYSEDLIEMRNDKIDAAEGFDVYTESMDVFDEDMANFIEDLDDDIDVGLGPRESMEAFEIKGQGADSGMGPRESESVQSSDNGAGVTSSPNQERGTL